MVLVGVERRDGRLIEAWSSAFSVDWCVNVDVRREGRVCEQSKRSESSGCAVEASEWCSHPPGGEGVASSPRGGMDACGHSKPSVNDSST